MRLGATSAARDGTRSLGARGMTSLTDALPLTRLFSPGVDTRSLFTPPYVEPSQTLAHLHPPLDASTSASRPLPFEVLRHAQCRVYSTVGLYMALRRASTVP